VRPQNLTEGCDLEVIGLQTKPELNGRCGSIVDFDDQAGRYVVFVQNHPTVVKLQPANCLLKAGANVVLCGLEVSDYNGQKARIVSAHNEDHRYTVCCQTGKEIRVKLANVVCSELQYKPVADVNRQRSMFSDHPFSLLLVAFVPVAFFMFVILHMFSLCWP